MKQMNDVNESTGAKNSDYGFTRQKEFFVRLMKNVLMI